MTINIPPPQTGRKPSTKIDEIGVGEKITVVRNTTGAVSSLRRFWEKKTGKRFTSRKVDANTYDIWRLS